MFTAENRSVDKDKTQKQSWPSLFSTSSPPDVIPEDRMCLVSIRRALVPDTAGGGECRDSQLTKVSQLVPWSAELWRHSVCFNPHTASVFCHWSAARSKTSEGFSVSDVHTFYIFREAKWLKGRSVPTHLRPHSSHHRLSWKNQIEASTKFIVPCKFL